MLDSSFKPVLIILAAGQSRRFGAVKLIAKVSTGNGLVPMLQWQYSKLQDFQWPILIATGQYHSLLSQLDIAPDLLHICDQAHLGMGHSISQISQIAQELYQPSHLLFMLADQVALTTADLTLLINQAKVSPNKIITSKTAQGLTAPSVFPARLLPELSRLSGDKGAKSIIKKHINDTQVVAIDNAQVDIDTEQDLLTWNRTIPVEDRHDQVTNQQTNG